ncbi:transposase [Thiohalorhabdus denitrificans]|uniref:Transposase n=6 Tax=Thiohalorhabdus denitrificans TaxID=381306 RepID=A0A0N8PNM2_9GAMM|nr:ISL3 family transposase [Thiohalorhabdus denitrificans]KPV41917.1 transposase [Thiohalorhabdus denitrificans]SCY68900.1 Transposase [Thiohalorhabdus denitrificans]
MQSKDILALGLGLESPWELVDQELNTEVEPHELHLRVSAPRGSLFPCPECGQWCKARDFKEMTWRHLNFFQHHAYITADVPRTDCPDCGVKRITVPWAREGSHFTLLFEQVALSLLREMPVNAAARQMGVTDKRLWRVVNHYVGRALDRIDLSNVSAIALDETAAKRGQHYVTVFIDLERAENPVIFATPGQDKDALRRFRNHLQAQGGAANGVWEVVCDMSQAFQAGVTETFPNASLTTDWFHVVQRVTDAMNDVRKAEAKAIKLPKGARWATLKAGERQRNNRQDQALAELEAMGAATGEAYAIKEKLRWVRQATSQQAARWRLTRFLRLAKALTAEVETLEPMRKALATIEHQFEAIIRRWRSTYSNARLEGLNSIFQAARARARGYRNQQTFITMIYLLAAPIGKVEKSI